jgi:hypothetical protein
VIVLAPAVAMTSAQPAIVRGGARYARRKLVTSWFANRLPRASASPLVIYPGDPSEPAATCHAGLRDSEVQMSLRQSESELPASRPEEDKSAEFEQVLEQEVEQDVSAEQAVVTVEEHALEQVVEQEMEQEVAAEQAVVTVEEHEEVQALLREESRPEEEPATGWNGVVKFLLRRVASWIVRPCPSFLAVEEAEQVVEQKAEQEVEQEVAARSVVTVAEHEEVKALLREVEEKQEKEREQEEQEEQEVMPGHISNIESMYIKNM